MTRTRPIAALILPVMLCLGGCAAGPGSVGGNVAAGINAAKLALTALETAAAVYAALPSCPAVVQAGLRPMPAASVFVQPAAPRGSRLCSNPDIVARLAAAEAQARALLGSVDANPELLQDLLTAIQSLRSLVPAG